MQSPQTPNFLRYHKNGSNNHPQLGESCSQPFTITYFERVLEEIDPQQMTLFNTTTQNLSYSPHKHQHLSSQPPTELHTQICRYIHINTQKVRINYLIARNLPSLTPTETSNPLIWYMIEIHSQTYRVVHKYFYDKKFEYLLPN
jgi:hypothetical protein